MTMEYIEDQILLHSESSEEKDIAHCQAYLELRKKLLEVKDRTYIIVSAYSMYTKTVMSDCDLYSSTEYDLSSKEVEPGYYHYFIFEYDSKTNAIQMIKTDKPLANRKEVARNDTNGVKLNTPQKGVNIILYSDGTSNKVIER